MPVTEENSPKILFPCKDYPVKIVGEATDAMLDFVLQTTAVHAPDFDRQKVSIQTSKRGRFQSVTVYITATGKEQLLEYHQALTAHDLVKMVL